ncbi:reverse transcriptase domain-containing protein [Tanacetum coccineum]
MQDAVEITTELMDKRVRTFAECQTESKRKFEDTSRNTQNQQQPNKRQNTGKAYDVRSGEKKPYGGSKPLCPKCNYYHDGPCAPKCHKCNKVGHLARDCRSTINANPANNQRGTGAGQKPTCYECGAQGHFKRECPKLKNNNQGNPVGIGNAPARAYVVGNAGTNLNANVVTGTFLLNNHYATILFDTGAYRSFVSTAFSSLIDIIPIALYYGMDVELADSRIHYLITFAGHSTDPTSGILNRFDTRCCTCSTGYYQLAPSEMKELSDQLKELSDKGFIRYSSCPLGSHRLFSRQKDGFFRMCILPGIERLTVKIRSPPLPRIDDFFDQL